MSDRPYTAAEVDRAVDALRDRERLSHASEVVTHAAPALQGVLVTAMHEGGWFDEAHEGEVSKAVSEPDGGERQRAVRTLLAEETRLAMLVGVAVGFQLREELRRVRESNEEE